MDVQIKLLSVVHHQYLVSLVGYCVAWKTKILVYEYMSGGDIYNRLHGNLICRNKSQGRVTDEEGKSYSLSNYRNLFLRRYCCVLTIELGPKDKDTDASCRR